MSLLEEELVSAKGNNETLTVEVEGLNAKINKADAKGTELETSGDPSVVENKKEDSETKFWNGIVSKMNLK